MTAILPALTMIESSDITQLARDLMAGETCELMDKHELYGRLRTVSRYHEECFQLADEEVKRRNKYKREGAV